jgi:CRISPR-associated protein Cas5d
MPKGVVIDVWGDYALFSRPELKSERYSYDIITPSAARGILDSIYYHPGMCWVIDKIHVINPIVFTNIRRNEVGLKASASEAYSVMCGNSKKLLYISAAKNIVQRASTILRDVRYVIEAHFELVEDKLAPSDSEEKFYAISMERIKKGKHFSQPYFGCREFTAHYCLHEGAIITSHSGVRDLGLMLYDMDYSDPENITPTFFRAVMVNGVVDLTDCEVLK